MSCGLAPYMWWRQQRSRRYTAGLFSSFNISLSLLNQSLKVIKQTPNSTALMRKWACHCLISENTHPTTDWCSHETTLDMMWSYSLSIDTIDKTHHPWSLPPDTHHSAKYVTLCWSVRIWTEDPRQCPLQGIEWILWVLRGFVVVHASDWMLNWIGSWGLWRLGLVHFIMFKNRQHASNWKI